LPTRRSWRSGGGWGGIFASAAKPRFPSCGRGSPSAKSTDCALAPGRARFLHTVAITADQFGPVSLALARHTSNGESWSMVREAPPPAYTPAKSTGGGLRLTRTSWTINPTACSSRARSCAMLTRALASAGFWRSRPSIWWHKGRRSWRSRSAAGSIPTGCAGTRRSAVAGTGSKPRWRAAGS